MRRKPNPLVYLCLSPFSPTLGAVAASTRSMTMRDHRELFEGVTVREFVGGVIAVITIVVCMWLWFAVGGVD